MIDQDKSKQELIEELAEMRRRVVLLETVLQENQSAAALLQIAPLGIHELDTTGRITFVNPSQEAITGYTADELVGTYAWDRIEPGPERDSLPAYLEYLVSEQPKPTPFFAKNIRKNGEVFHVRIDWDYKRNPQGQVTGFVCIVCDITEKKRAEEARQESEERFKLFMDNSPAIAWMKDEQGRYVYVNESCGRRIGVRPEDRIGKTDFELWPGETAELFRKNDQQVLASGQVVEVIEESIMPDGHRSYCRNFKFPFQDSTGRRFVGGVGIDITERRQSEEALEKAYDELEQRVKERTAQLVKANDNLEIFRRFAEDSDQGFGMSDFDGRIVYANPTLCRLFGENEPEDVIGKNVSAYYPKEYMQRRKEELIPALLREGHWHIEPTVLPRHGKPIQTLQSTFLIRDADGSPLRIAVVISDITERKQAEEALRQSHGELQAIYDGMADGLLVTDIETKRFVRANAAICRMLGYSEAELLSLSVMDIHPAEALPHILKQIGLLDQTPGCIPLLRKDGSVFYAEVIGRFLVYSGKPRAMAIFRDITERKQVEEALRASEERFRVTFEEAPVGMVIGQGDGVVVKANHALCHMSGYSQEELIGQHVRDLTHPEDRELSGPLVKRLLGGEISSFRLEKRYLRKDGQPFWAQATTAAARGPDGKIVFTLGVVEDIDERKRAEEALRQSEERYDLAVRGAGVGIWDWDIRTGKLYFSPRWKKMFGFEETEIGESLEDWARLLHPDEKDWMLKFLEDFLAGTSPTVTVEYRLRHKDGSYRWIVATGLVLRDEQGKAYRFVGSHGDITDRKRAEEALQRSEERHRTLMDNIHSGITVMDRELNIVMLNKASAAFIGRPTGKCIGKECFRVFRKQDAVCPDCPGVRAMNTGLPAEIENIGTRDDGSVYVARVRAYPIFAADGHVEGFVELVDDITDRKRAEEALAKEHRNLRYMLRSSDYERQLIAYEIHDGLAQQLAAAIMQFQAYGHLKDTQPKQAAKAYDAGLTMLQQGHFEARRLIAGVRPPILDESGVVEAVAHLVHEQGRDQGPKIEYHSRVDFDRLDPTFENAIYRIAQEALTNACMHSKSERISVSLLQREDRLRIEIRDWGVGFDPKTGPKNRFGLEGIRQRARLLGGKCNIRSKAGKGTRITVELPVIPRDEEV